MPRRSTHEPSTPHSTVRTGSDQELELLALLPQLAMALRAGRRDVPENVRALIDRAQGLGPRHVSVMIQLALHGPQSVSDLSSRLGVTLPTTSLMVGELSQAGLVERREDAADRRRTIVNISDSYAPELIAMIALRIELLSRVLASLEPAERDGFIKGLRVLVTELTSRETGDNASGILSRCVPGSE